MTAETSVDDGVSVAQLYEYSEAINNMKHYVLRHKLFFYTKMGLSSVVSSGSTDEKVLIVAAPFQIPHGYNYFRLKTMTKQSGTGTVTWRFYASRIGPYSGSSTLDTSKLGVYTTDNVVSTSSLERSCLARWQVVQGEAPTIWIVVTAQSSVGTATSELYTAEIWGEMV